MRLRSTSGIYILLILFVVCILCLVLSKPTNYNECSELTRHRETVKLGKDKIIVHQILIIDDDRELCALLKRQLQSEQIQADCCYSGREGITALSEGNYQLVVLDIMMPGLSGFDVLEKIREGSSVPVLMLTAKDDNASKVRGLRSGADDYLAKPFNMDEFLARVASLIRRYTVLNGTVAFGGVLSYTGLKINLDERSITTGQGTFELPNKEFELLLYLAHHQGRIMTKKQIYEAVWQEEYCYDDASIMVMISKLRKKVEPDPTSPTVIQTVKGIGYRFNKEL